MKQALIQAQNAYKIGEVPVGALIVHNLTGEVLSLSHNTKESTHNPCGHAEILAIMEAAKKLNSWRLNDCSLFVTLEPCMMCSGAIIQARLDHVFFGAYDPKSGFVESLSKAFKNYSLNHKPQSTGGILESECSKLLKSFFKEKRKCV